MKSTWNLSVLFWQLPMNLCNFKTKFKLDQNKVSHPRQDEEGICMGGLPKARCQGVSRKEVLHIKGQLSIRYQSPSNIKKGRHCGVRAAWSKVIKTKWSE